MNANNTLREYIPEERLTIFKFLLSACTHVYSKGKLNTDKFNELMPSFVKLTKEDPVFMAKLTAWSFKKESKDLQVLTVFFNSLSDADGTPFFKGSNKNKPNFRIISAILLQEMSPHLALRVMELTRYKFSYDKYLSDGAHYSSIMKSAFKKYLLYRENNLNIIKGIKNAGLSKKLISMYKMMYLTPTIESASILNWKQRNRKLNRNIVDFNSMTSSEIANYIKTEKIGVLVSLSMVPSDKMNVEIAKVIMEIATGNQVVILNNLFRTKGFLEIPEIKELFDIKIQDATTAIDRIDTLSKNLSDDDKKIMSNVRSKGRKKEMGNIGKIYLHIDVSGSMSEAIEYAKNNSSIIAEMVNDPTNNFNWGLFGSIGRPHHLPKFFTKEDFHEVLYGVTAHDGSTDCLGTYKLAREFGADVDIYLTDQGHNVGDFSKRLKKLVEMHGRPKSTIIIDFGDSWNNGYYDLKSKFELEGIPCVVIKSDIVLESALVTNAIKTAILGELEIVNDIMETNFPQLPKWYNDPILLKTYKIRLAG